MSLDLRIDPPGEIEAPQMFQLRLQAEELTLRRPTSDFESMESLDSSPDTILYPHQVHAAHFAVSNPMLRGVLLADEVGLGKTIEAGMIIKETVYRGGRNVLIMAARSLCQQWRGEMEERFGLDFAVLDTPNVKKLQAAGKDPFSGMRVTTYHYVHHHLDEFARTPWDLVIIDEAHKLKNPEGAHHESTKKLPKRFVCLLTATPIQNDLLELWSISTIIDERALGTEFSFREKFCGDTRGLVIQNADDLKDRLSNFAIRTLRSDVPEIKFTARIPKLFDFTLNSDERRLYEGVSRYLSEPNWAFGDGGGKYMILLIYRKLLASSSFALQSALHKLVARLEAMVAGREAEELEAEDLGDDVAASVETVEESERDERVVPDGITHSIEAELTQVREFARLCDSITENAKAQRIVEAMPELLNAGSKVLIFTQYIATQQHLARRLRQSGYDVLEFSGQLKKHANPDKDEQEQVKRRFRDHADVMIATDAGAEGLNLQFCHIIVNYDLPWNPMKIEQRIGRCHRIGQQHDVVVANLVARDNEADQRIVELLMEKIHLFDSVLGGTDEILGSIEDGMDFERRIFNILQSCRDPEEIDHAFDQLQLDLEDVLEDRKETGTSLLLGGFDERLRDHLKVAERETQKALDSRTEMLRDFCLDTLDYHGAQVVQEDDIYEVYTPSQFFLHCEDLLDPKYRGTFRREADPSVSRFTKDHPFVEAALSYHRDQGHRSAMRLLYTGNHNIHGMEELVGSEGWWLNFKVTFEGYETEDHLLSLALLHQNGELIPNELLTENVSRITNEPLSPERSLPLPEADVVSAWLEPRIAELFEEIQERNAGYYLERREVLDEYYGAKGDGEVLAERRHQVEETKRAIAELDDQIDAASSSTEKATLYDERDKLEDRLFDLEGKMLNEQRQHAQEKREALRKLDDLRELSSEVRLVNLAQWELV
ncbi:MAG: SNF2-related protein [Armatimonadota bacterium]|jgi:superfamily II DNA or RNA helicase